MTQFEFVLVFISIVVAFGVSDILSSWGEQVRLRNRVRHYPLHTAWAGLVLIMMMQVWWSLWAMRDRTVWTFFEYMVLMIPFLTLALIAYIFTPKFDDAENDVKQYYFDHCRWVFSLGAFYLISWIIFSNVVLGHPVNEAGSLPRLAGLFLMVGLAVWKNERFHAGAVILAYFLLAAWLAAVVASI